ncbi:DUF2306 domain-containing protein [Ferrimonas pelagia]|uniref:DUF2306 domain-containing protein n=1 Tax=Ferrimonas pelagia TaxID=1177826 RepID=A0ABP9EN18_9GAMM
MVGSVHFCLASAALLLGPIVLWRPKGTVSHRWLGRIWVVLLALSNLAALLLVREHGLSLFTFLALYSLVSVTAAFYLAWRKPQPSWRVWHYYLMCYGYLGVLAAALARFPVLLGMEFWLAVFGTMAITFALGGWLTERGARRRFFRH